MGQPTIPYSERHRRIEAIIAYSGKSKESVAAELEEPHATFRRHNKRRNMEDCYAIADICGVPRAFMEEGFTRYAEPTPLERVLNLEKRLDGLIEGLKTGGALSPGSRAGQLPRPERPPRRQAGGDSGR